MTQPTRSIEELNAYIALAEDSGKAETKYSLELARRIKSKNTLVSNLINRNGKGNQNYVDFYNEIRETNNELMREVIDAVQEARDLQREADGPVVDSNGTVLQDADPHGLRYDVLVTAMRPDSRIHSMGDEWGRAEQERKLDSDFQKDKGRDGDIQLGKDNIQRMWNYAVGAADHIYQTPMTERSAEAVTQVIKEQLRDYKENNNCNLAQKHFADVIVANAQEVCQSNWGKAGLDVDRIPVLGNAKQGHNPAVKPPSGPGMSL